MSINILISKEQIADFVVKTRIFGQHGKGKNKSIDVLVNPVEKRVWYEFSNNKTVIYTGPELDEAISLYNAA